MMFMKNLLVPTDFSQAAENAFAFAVAMARKQHRGVTLLHVYRPPIEVTYPVLMPPLDEPDGLRKFFFGDRLRENVVNGVPVTYEVTVGFVVDSLVEFSRDEQTDLIVMGMQGEHSAAERWLGSVTTDTLREAFCPVLAVPEHAAFVDFDRILYATDLTSADQRPVHELIAFAARFGAEVHFVNLNSDLDRAEEVVERLVENVSAETEHAVAFHIATLDGDQLATALNDYAASHRIDLVAMSTRHRGFFEGIFHRSRTKQMALHAQKPVLVLHWEDKPLA
jgi:nucleotide-binding universal stress UspA family protein